MPHFDFKKPLLMGVLNITPDSFSDGGQFLNPDDALKHALQMVSEGAAVIDIGAESSRPGAEQISAQEELRRLMPVIQKIKSKPDIFISVDTTKSEVAREALKAGANMINDISGLIEDPHMWQIVKDSGCYIVAMHRLAKSKTMQNNPHYDDVVKTIEDFFKQTIVHAQKLGIERNKLILDPGIGFGKTLDHNLQLIRAAGRFLKLGYPVLYGISRKSFIGHLLNQPDPKQRLTGTLSITAELYAQGVRFFRVHDVAAHRDLFAILQTAHSQNAYAPKWITPAKKQTSVVCYLGLGSNLGDRQKYLEQAVDEIKSDPDIQFIRHSSWIETRPEGKTDQPMFFNGVAEIQTHLHPVTLLQRLKAIEQKMGRIHREEWGPREIDLDILFYGDQLICEESLTIPHPLLHARVFVLKPLMELAPDLIHPTMDQTIRELLVKLS